MSATNTSTPDSKTDASSAPANQSGESKQPTGATSGDGTSVTDKQPRARRPAGRGRRPSGDSTLVTDKQPAASGDGTSVADKRPAASVPTELTQRQRVWAAAILLFWLNLFAGGMLIDTEPYRCTISWSAIDSTKLDPKVIANHPCQAYWGPETVKKASGGEEKVFNRYIFDGEAERPLQPVMTWLVALLFFTPLNLAFISASAGMLGSLGSIANLNPDPGSDAGTASNSAQDRTNPLISGLLRGMFVYLFMISGMLLFDDSPFSATSADQYLRLAGFVSLFSFIVNYQPNVFGTLIAWANERINSRGKSGGYDLNAQGGAIRLKTQPGSDLNIITDENMAAASVDAPDAADMPSGPAAVKAGKLSRNGNSKRVGPKTGG